MGMYDGLSELIRDFSKEDIAKALLHARRKRRVDRQAVLDLENQNFEIIEALGLLPERASHSEVVEFAYNLRKGTADQAIPS